MEYHSSNNTNGDRSATVQAASGSNNRKPATAQQLIRENVKYLIEQLEAGQETLTAYLMLWRISTRIPSAMYFS